MHVPSADVVAVEYCGDFGTSRVINIYNNGEHDKTLKVVFDFMRGETLRRPRGKERNAHLFTAAGELAVQPLLQLLGHYRMKMPLLKDVPTLRADKQAECPAVAKGTKNLTRPDNVFCSDDFLPFFISCDAYPARTPGTTDHFPVITMIDLVPATVDPVPHWNWRQGNWEDLHKMLATELEADPLVNGYASIREVKDALVLSEQRKAKEKLGQESYRQIEVPTSPVHEEYRRARNDLSAAIKVARTSTWTEWLEDMDKSEVWTAGQMMKSEASDRGCARIPDLKRKGPGGRETVAVTNEEFYPERGPGATDPPEDTA
ncbi:hypothetical protein B0H15DRAFT_953252 [Mycena belliarum]|uniref:Uncharacterized protein n=1 Tax=Mycena belliarum TaxID=1033014 RepID=A0AAD6TZJ4_9AGAR|nr:hypothetical protein B0H15DRAFT_953252 [Mycena belliae]